MNSGSHRVSSTDQAAVFIDYDNLVELIDADEDASHPAVDYVAEIHREVRRYLEEGDDTPTILSRAYADFSELDDVPDVMAVLDDEAVEPRVASSAGQPNASEIRLCIDVMSMLHQRPDLKTFVIITGNRLYVPLVRAIRENGARALVAALHPPHPDEPIPRAEEDLYLDARNLLGREYREDLSMDDSGSRSSGQRSAPASASSQRYNDLTDDILRRTVFITEEYFGQYDEVYLTPLLRKLSDVLGEQHDPKTLVSRLEAAGAVRLEKRDGYPYDYTVLIVNEDHPDVQEIQDEFYSNRSTYSGNGTSDDYDDYDPGEHEEEGYDYDYGSYEPFDDYEYDEEEDYDEAAEYDEDEYDEPDYREPADDATYEDELYEDEPYDEDVPADDAYAEETAESDDADADAQPDEEEVK